MVALRGGHAPQHIADMSPEPSSTPPGRRRRIRSLLLVLTLTAGAAAATACAPRAQPLTGIAVQEAVPDAQLEGARRLVFRWEYLDGSLVVRGEGVARIAAPDSARLDLYLDGGLGGGTAFLIGDEIDAPGGSMVRRLLPPPPLMWAALGRMAVPPAADTLVTREGDTLRADIGRDPVWRVAFTEALVRLERISGGRVIEFVDRTEADGREVRYRNAADRRSLSISIQRDERVEGFDASVWER